MPGTLARLGPSRRARLLCSVPRRRRCDPAAGCLSCAWQGNEKPCQQPLAPTQMHARARTHARTIARTHTHTHTQVLGTLAGGALAGLAYVYLFLYETVPA